MNQLFHVIIPARYQSLRFPGKLLQEIHGLTVLERVYRQALLAKPASVLIATDHERIAEMADAFGAEVIMTSAEHQSGTDRLAEAVAKKGYAQDAIIVNVQGDEPFIQPELIQQVAQMLAKSDSSVATLCAPITSLENLHSPHVVKVVLNQHNQAMYFSRSPIPCNRDDSSALSGALAHIGLYAYKAGFLSEFVQWPSCSLERTEALEQLRILWQGHAILVGLACVKPMQDINTREDLEKARQLLTPV